MEKPVHVDLTHSTFDEFIRFLFDHEVPISEGEEPWYWHVEVEFGAIGVCGYFVRLFRQPEFLLPRFTKPQLEQGFWAIQGPNLDCSVSRLIDESGLPLAIRQECITSMFNLFERLFARESLDTSVYMRWDSLCYDWHCGNRRRERGGEDLALQDIFFDTLARVLGLDSLVCEASALHGLSHLHHPHTKDLVDGFIRGRPSLTPERIEYALAASKFELL